MNNQEQNKKTLPNAADFMDSYFGDGFENYTPTVPVKTGYSKIDELLGGGLLPGTYSLSAGSGLGKSTLAQNLVENIAEKQGINVLLYSLELSQKIVTLKGISRYAKKNFADDLSGTETVKDIPTFTELLTKNVKDLDGSKPEIATAAFKEYKEKIAPYLYIREKVPMGADGIRNFLTSLENEIKELSKDKPCVVVIDYFQYLYFGGNQEVRFQIDETVRRIQDLAEKYRVPIILINAQSKAGDLDKSGSDNYIKESGGIKYTVVGTLVLTPHTTNNGEQIIDESGRRVMRLYLKKSRFGVPERYVLLALDGAYADFVELEEENLKDSSKKTQLNRSKDTKTNSSGKPVSRPPARKREK